MVVRVVITQSDSLSQSTQSKLGWSFVAQMLMLTLCNSLFIDIAVVFTLQVPEIQDSLVKYLSQTIL